VIKPEAVVGVVAEMHTCRSSELMEELEEGSLDGGVTMVQITKVSTRTKSIIL
jgi:hypothetical protein